MTSDGLRAHIAADSRGQWIVLTDETDINSAQASGRWIKTINPAEITQ